MDRPAILVLRLLIGCINIPTKVGAKAWAACFRRLAARADIFGINEAGSPRAKDLYDDLMRELGLSQFGLWRGPNPVFWKTDVYDFVSGEQVQLHRAGRGRLARRWRGFNGPRFMTVVVLRHRATGREVTFINWHWVAPGWKVLSKWRSRMRVRSKRLLRREIASHRAAGRIVAGVGDTNLRLAFYVLKMWRWLRRKGVDKLGLAVLDGDQILDVDVEVFAAPTDHRHGLSAEVDIEIGAAA